VVKPKKPKKPSPRSRVRTARSGDGSTSVATGAKADVSGHERLTRRLVHDHVMLAEQYAMRTRELLYSATRADPARGRKMLAVARILKAAWAAYVMDESEVLTALEKTSREYLEVSAWRCEQKSGRAMVDLSAYAADGEGWFGSLGDIVPEKGEQLGRMRDVTYRINTIAAILEKRLFEGTGTVNALAESIVIGATLPFGAEVDFLSEQGIRLHGVLDDEGYKARVRDAETVIARRLDRSPRVGSPQYRPRNIARLILQDVLVLVFGADRKKTEHFAGSDLL
jgi:hypothetical protein